MPKQDHPYRYLWRYPENYKRLTAEDLNNDETVVAMCEIILRGIREETLYILSKLNRNPGDADLRREAREMYAYLESDEVSSISFGGSASLAEMFRRRCPKGVFDE